MPINKNHWYDGWFYERLIAPHQDRLFGQIQSLMLPGSSVIDVGCGTGRFAFAIADRCKAVLGIDISARNIRQARRRLSKKNNSRIMFEHKDITEVANEGKIRFDYAVLTYVIHEIADWERPALVKEISMIADTIIIGDYLIPLPPGWRSGLNEIVEYAAGEDHYANFSSFRARGGIRGLVETLPFTILQEIRNSPQTSHIVVLETKRVSPIG